MFYKLIYNNICIQCGSSWRACPLNFIKTLFCLCKPDNIRTHFFVQYFIKVTYIKSYQNVFKVKVFYNIIGQSDTKQVTMRQFSGHSMSH